MTTKPWTPRYNRWRHGGWYVSNVQYPKGFVACVYPKDGKWYLVEEAAKKPDTESWPLIFWGDNDQLAVHDAGSFVEEIEPDEEDDDKESGCALPPPS